MSDEARQERWEAYDAAWLKVLREYGSQFEWGTPEPRSINGMEEALRVRRWGADA